MARPRLKSRICPSMVACDGADLAAHRVICGACERKLRQREAKEEAPRGTGYMPMSKAEKARRRAEREARGAA